jgi:LmbE family N-acetylglucosaminyl deacetylase
MSGALLTGSLRLIHGAVAHEDSGTGNAASSDPSVKLKILVTGAHPGDPEYGCGGTICHYTDLGHKVVVLYLTRGQAGSPDKSTAEASAIRTAEAKEACTILGARPVFLEQMDGTTVVNPAQSEAYLKVIQIERPDIVFTHWPIDNHPDHRVDSMPAYSAWVQTGKRFSLYYYEVSTGEDTFNFAPAQYMDTSAFEARKRSACFTHASQSPDKFYKIQERVAIFRGVESGCAQAEAFIRHGQSRAKIGAPA